MMMVLMMLMMILIIYIVGILARTQGRRCPDRLLGSVVGVGSLRLWVLRLLLLLSGHHDLGILPLFDLIVVIRDSVDVEGLRAIVLLLL